MLMLTVGMTENGMVTYQADEYELQLMGEFLTRDVSMMTDVVRDFLSGENQSVTFYVCTVTKQDNTICIHHVKRPELPTVFLSVERVMALVDIWEDFLEHRRPVQWIVFDKSEFVSARKSQRNAGAADISSISESVKHSGTSNAEE